MDFKNLSEEQKARAMACKSTDGLIELAKDEGYALSDEELEAISGGSGWSEDCSDKSHRKIDN